MRLAASRAQLRPGNLRSSDVFCFEENFAALPGTDDLQMTAAFPCHFAGGFHHAVDHLIVVAGVMMKQQQCLNLCLYGEGNSAGNRTVSPPNMRRVLLIGVLRIEYEN